MHNPVLILAPPRSFTSVICAMLGQHPQMYGMPELNLFVAETMAERVGLIAQPRWSGHGLVRAVAQLVGGAQTVQTVALAQRWIAIRANRRCVSVFQELAAQANPRILVEKSPRTILKAEYLWRARRAFPGARYIHLLRHPRSQCESLWKLGGQAAAVQMDALDYSTTPATLDPQKAWFGMHVNILTFLAGVPPSQQLRVQGEAVLGDPPRALQQIAAWLGLRTDWQAIEEMLHPERSPFARIGPPGARLGNDPNFLRQPRLRPSSSLQEPRLDGPLPWRNDHEGFTAEVRQLAHEFGYR